MQKLSKYLGVAVALLTLASCVRPAGDAPAVTMTLDLQKIMSNRQSRSAVGATWIPARVIVNVTGNGIAQPVVYNWGVNPAAITAPPATVTVAVPSGTSRLIQVAMAYMVPDGNANYMAIEYGEVTTDLLSNSVAVSVPLTLVPNTLIGDGRIIGRYVNTDGTGPTGMITTYASLNTKMQPILDGQYEIFNGYFQIKMDIDLLRTAYLPDGTTLFANASVKPTATNSLLSQKFPGSTALSYVPDLYVLPTLWETQTFAVYGFYGPGVTATNQVCGDNSQTPGSRGADTLINGVSLLPTGYPGNMSNLTTGFLFGGVGVPNVTACTGTQFKDYFWVAANNYFSRNTALNFLGPYMTVAGGNGIVDTSVTNTVRWNYLPGVGNHGVDGSDLFFSSAYSSANGNNVPFKNMNDQYDCASLVSKYGFTSVARVPAPATDGSINSVSATTGSGVFILCPYKKNATGTGVTYYLTAVSSN